MGQAVNHLNKFIETVSIERFKRYQTLVANDDLAASELYTANAKIAESFYIPMQALEVTLRNRINDVLKEEIGPYWFDSPNFLTTNDQLEAIVEAKIRIKAGKKKEESPINESRIIAALPLGFWTAMFNHDYEELWRQRLNRIVVSGVAGATRKTFSGQLSLIRKIRNRIAHHECIVDGRIENIHKAILDLMGYLSPEARFWINENSSFERVFKEHEVLIKRIRHD